MCVGDETHAFFNDEATDERGYIVDGRRSAKYHDWLSYVAWWGIRSEFVKN